MQDCAGDYPAALASLDSAITQGADDAALWTLQGDVFLAAAQAEAAQSAYQRALQHQPQDPELPEKLARSQPPPRWRLDAGISLEDYSNERGGEHSQFLQPLSELQHGT